MREFTKELIRFTNDRCKGLNLKKSKWYETVIAWIADEIESEADND